MSRIIRPRRYAQGVPDIFDEFLDELKRRQAGGDDEGPSEPGPGGTGPDDEEPDGEDRPPPPPLRRRRPRQPGGRSIRLTWAIAGIVVALLLVLSIGVGFWTDVLWYRSVGFEAVLWTRVGATGGLFFGATIVALVVLLGNLYLARRLAPPADPSAGAGLGAFFERLNQAAQSPGGGFGRPRPVVVGPATVPDLAPLATLVITGLSVLAALAIGGAVAGSWQTVLLFLHRVPYGLDAAKPVTDPVFGRDISFFLFDLPFLRVVQSTFNTLIIGALLVAFGRYFAGTPQSGLRFPTPVRAHLAILGGLYLLSVAFGYQLDKFELVYSTRMPLSSVGVSFTDATAQFPAYDVLTVVSGLAAAFLIGAAFTRWTWPLGFTVVAWLLASLILGRLYPEAIQRFVVAPNQLAKEELYLANNIAMTRLSFGLDRWDVKPYQGEAALTAQQIQDNAATFQNARLWDYRPLGATLDQLQTVRRYYDFVDVDTDRYAINNQLRQVMLSARELDLAANPGAVGWVNQRIIYTHGIGLVMVPVNEVTPEGQPVLFVKNLPPVSSDGAPTITEPRIYFGEKPTGYVVVGARQAEFDYPRGETAAGSGDTGAPTTWSGETGIRLDTTFSRLLFAIRFGDLDLLISDQVQSTSQLLMHRSLAERLGLLAPFLSYDKDPYLVVDGNGRLVYVQDAFTTTDRFPNAQAFDTAGLPGTGLGPGSINYIRNSVKVVMDAYSGAMHFYIADPADPLIRAYAGIFPSLFSPLSELPPALEPHLRYPEELFNVQTRMYGRYHVVDPETFYGSNDLWTVPADQTNTQSLPPEAYYVVMRMPGEAQPEFLLLQPMVPTSRPNMIAWIAARNDDPNYGTVRVFRFPSDTTILGPAQIEARIDQDPTISAQITLWNQSGSSVIRGNLIVVPIGDALIYLQPVYLQSTSSKFPEFQRIVVASPTAVVWSRTLGDALKQLLATNSGGPGATPAPGPTPSPGTNPTPGPTPAATAPGGLPSDVPGLIEYANTHFELAQQALRDGDFAGYGREIELVRQALAQLDQLAGPTPSP